MMKYAVKNLDNKEVSQVDLDEGIYGLDPRADIISRVVNWQMSKRQAGTHKTKGITDISGTTRKPFNQKGGGRARQGSLRSPQFRGGATIFGPVVRSHAYSLPKKIRALGLKLALSSKAKSGNLIILSDLNMGEGKTKNITQKLANMGLTSALIIDGATVNESFKRAAANVPNIDVLPQAGLNGYDILRRQTLVLTVEALSGISARFQAKGEAA